MTIDSAVRTYLLTLTGITTYIVDRIYPATIEPANSVTPYIIYAEINSQEGIINEAESYDKFYQFTIYADTYTLSQSLKESIKSAFYHKPNASYTDVYIKTAAFRGSRDFPYDPISKVYAASVDIKIEYIKLT